MCRSGFRSGFQHYISPHLKPPCAWLLIDGYDFLVVSLHVVLSCQALPRKRWRRLHKASVSGGKWISGLAAMWASLWT